MMKRTVHTIINWSVLIIIFMLFLIWNGAFDKPLSMQEIEEYVHSYQELNPKANTQVLREFMNSDDGKPVIMVNVIKLYDEPQQIDGTSNFESSKEALADYTSFVIPYLLKRGSYPIFNGTAIYTSMEVWGIEGAEEWTTGALMRYKSRRVMMEMVTDPVFNQFHYSKIAAIEKTFAFPASQDLHFFDLTVVVAAILIIVGLLVQLLIMRKAYKKR